MSSQSGQGAVELVIVLSCVGLIVSFCFIITLVGFTKSFIQHVGYQSLICRQTDGVSQNQCEKQVRKSLKLLPFGRLKKLNLTKNKVFVQWQMVFFKRSLLLTTSQSFNLKEWL